MAPSLSLRTFGWFVVVLPGIGLAHRILMFPINVDSHFQYFGRMGHGLAKQGHDVEMIVPSNGKIPRELETTNFTITTYKVEAEISLFSTREASEMYMEYALAENKLLAHFKIGRWWIGKSTESVNKDCEDLMRNFQLMERLLNQSKIDFVISDIAMTQCHQIFIKSFGAPYAILSLPVLPWILGIARFPSFVPSFTMAYSDKMTFVERLSNLIVELSSAMLFTMKMTPSNIPDYMGSKFTTHEESFVDVLRNASLFFFLEDLTVGYGSPLTPDTISVGDISAGSPAKNPLPPNIDQFLQDKIAVYISFGSFFNYPSEDLIKIFCSAFHLLKDFQFIWKLKLDKACGSEITNLLTLTWAPQNDLLADSRIKLFITHGGFNSVMETVYHSKPIIVLPLAADQPYQATVAEVKGYGRKMDLRYLTSEDLASNVTEMLVNTKYAEKAKYYSDILKNRRHGPAERASEAIDIVVRFGHDYLRSSARELYWFQFMMFDLFVALQIVIAVVIFPTSCASYGLLKYIFRKTFASRKKLKVT